MKKRQDSSFETSAEWYDRVVGEKGHYYHQHVILPNLLRMLNLDKYQNPSIVDFGCGQGLLARYIPSSASYLGIDISPTLIQSAKIRSKKDQLKTFLSADLSVLLPSSRVKYTHGVFLLSLQNMEDLKISLQNAAQFLQRKGRLFIVLNHPCFRIPRQSSWGVDEKKQIQFRRVDRYLSSLQIPIQTHPGKERKAKTWSFHHSLSTYSQSLYEAGFVIEKIEEWCSDKKSEGGRAKMENFSRLEFPLFLAIQALYLDDFF